jgi:transposase
MAHEQERPDVLKRRRAWFDGQPDLDPERLVFIDETWASTNMARSHGRAPRGERLRMAVPHGHWKTTTLVAGLGVGGVVAPWVLDGPINGNAFETYVDKILVPELRRGDIVVMDNLSSHKRPEVRALIEAAGARLLFLPPYSPDFNPIEKASPSSRPCCARPPSERLTGCGDPSAVSSTSSRQPRLGTTSKAAGTMQTDGIPL